MSLGVLLLLEVVAARAEDHAALKALFGSFDKESDFDLAAAAARRGDVPASTIGEARMIRALKAGDLKTIYKMRGELDQIVTDWEARQSTFDTREKAAMVVAYAEAMAAKDAGDMEMFKDAVEQTFWLAPADGKKLGEMVLSTREDPKAEQAVEAANFAARGDDAAAFEQAVKKAFWLSPESGPGLGKLVEEFRTRQRIAHLKVPLDVPMMTSDGKKVTLKDLLGKKPGVFIQFWASWSAPCVDGMKRLQDRAKLLLPEGVVTVAINVEHDPALAEKVRTDHGMTIPWLVEPADAPYSKKLLAVNSVPQVWVVTQEGKLLYAGRPEDDELAEVVTKNFGAVLPAGE